MQLPDITPVVALSFLEFLIENSVSHTSIANYTSAIKANLSLYGLSTVAFLDPRIAYFQRSLKLNKPYAPTLKKIIDIPLLQAIVAICDTMWMGQIFKALYLTAFFSFLRISNLVPHSILAFSPLEQITRGDTPATPGIHLLIKWTKTIQNRDSIRILKIPTLGDSPICQDHNASQEVADSFKRLLYTPPPLQLLPSWGLVEVGHLPQIYTFCCLICNLMSCLKVTLIFGNK